MALVVDGFDEVYGPEWFADSTFAGIVPGTYACEDEFSCAYIGQQWNYTRTDPWTNDDNCGWGACYRDHAGQLTVGNTHNYAALHGQVLRKIGISYVSCTAGMVMIDSSFTMVDYICGRNRVPMNTECLQQIADYLDRGGRLLLSTDHFSAIDPVWAKRYLHTSYYAAQATHSGRINGTRHRLYHLLLEPNEEQLFTCTSEGLNPEGTGANRTALYMDMRCGAAVGYTNAQGERTTLLYGFPLEAVRNFESIYKYSIEWLLAK
jgi:hypothetical protein